MSAPVFISHSSKDQKVARTICTALEKRGLSCWIAARNVGPGENFQEAIVRAIRAAKVMVLVFTGNANNSAEIKRELALASRYGLLVIPARVENVVPSEAFEFEFATRQWIDLFEDWDHEIERLSSWIGGIVPVERAGGALEPVESRDARLSHQPIGEVETPVAEAGAAKRTISTGATVPLSSTERSNSETPKVPITASIRRPATVAVATAIAASLAVIAVLTFYDTKYTPTDENRPSSVPQSIDQERVSPATPPADSRLPPTPRPLDQERTPRIAPSAETGRTPSVESPPPQDRGALAILRGHEGPVWSATFSPNGKRVVTTGDWTARLWDAETGKEIAVLKGHTGPVSGAAFSPDGKRVVTAGDNTARLWDLETGKEVAVLKGMNSLGALFSPDGKRLVTASSDPRLWDAETGKEIARLKGYLGPVRSAAFSPDGRRVVTGSGDYRGRLWDAKTGKEILVLNGHTNTIRSAAFSPDGKRVATASEDQTARLWDAEMGKEIFVLNGHTNTVQSAAFSPDGQRVVTASDDGTARLWDAQTGKEIFVLIGHTYGVQSAAFSPDGKRVVTAGDNTARLWDVETGKEVAIFKGHEFVYAASFSPDGQRVVTASSDKTARIWDATVR
jgi:WD40 repeat protein